MFDLPSKLNEFINEHGSYAMAVKYYCKARRTLDHYKQMPTFRSIEDECTTIIKNLKSRLYEQIDSTQASSEVIFESIDLLFKLGEPMDQLCSKYISRAEKCFDADLSVLTLNIDLLVNKSEAACGNKNGSRKVDDLTQQAHDLNHEIAMDILEFVDYGCNHFLAGLSAVIQSFNTIFLNAQYSRK